MTRSFQSARPDQRVASASRKAFPPPTAPSFAAGAFSQITGGAHG